MNRHVLIEVSGGVVTNVLTHCEDRGGIAIWIRDYDALEEEGVSREVAETIPPTLTGFGQNTPWSIPPAKFTKRKHGEIDK